MNSGIMQDCFENVDKAWTAFIGDLGKYCLTRLRVWNGKSKTEGLRNRYSKALEALRALKKLKYHRSREVDSELRDVWRSFPQLEDKTGLDQLSKSCDELLAALESQGR